MSDMSDQQKLIQLVPSNPEWPNWFEQISKKLNSSLNGLILSIDHIGSTSIPGLASKNRIDVQITVQEINDEFKNKLDRALISGGFKESRWEKDHRPPGDESSEENWKKLYLSGTHSELTFRANIHVRAKGMSNQIYPLLFRDYLRAHPDSAGVYQRVKEELVRFHANDSIAYTELKDPACDLIMVNANTWARQTNWKPHEQKSLVTQPHLETARLLLEPYKDSDLQDIFDYGSNPQITQFVPWTAHKTLEDSQKFLDFIRTSTCNISGKLFFVFAIRLKETGKVIGSIDFKNPNAWTGQIDYALSVDYWNQGIMTESAQAVKTWALEACPKMVRLQAGCLPENKGSSRVMEKIGMQFEGVRRKSHYWGNGEYKNLAFYALVRD